MLKWVSDSYFNDPFITDRWSVSASASPDQLERTRWPWSGENHRRLSIHSILSNARCAHPPGHLPSTIWRWIIISPLVFLLIFQPYCPSPVGNAYGWWKPLITCADLFTPTINRLPARMPSNRHMSPLLHHLLLHPPSITCFRCRTTDICFNDSCHLVSTLLLLKIYLFLPPPHSKCYVGKIKQVLLREGRHSTASFLSKADWRKLAIYNSNDSNYYSNYN